MRLINNSFGLGQRLQAFPLTLSRGITEPNISEREIKMEQLTEQIKPIKGYEGIYSISNYGYVISLKRYGCKKDRILKAGIDTNGYPYVMLCKNGKLKIFKLHILVWDYFGDRPRNGHILQVDHKDEDKLNPQIDNLQLLSQRENSSKSNLIRKNTSKYTGVNWHKQGKKWTAFIRINSKSKYLGSFTNEYNAHLAYQKALNGINQEIL